MVDDAKIQSSEISTATSLMRAFLGLVVMVPVVSGFFALAVLIFAYDLVSRGALDGHSFSYPGLVSEVFWAAVPYAVATSALVCAVAVAMDRFIKEWRTYPPFTRNFYSCSIAALILCLIAFIMHPNSSWFQSIWALPLCILLAAFLGVLGGSAATLLGVHNVILMSKTDPGESKSQD